MASLQFEGIKTYRVDKMSEQDAEKHKRSNLPNSSKLKVLPIDQINQYSSVFENIKQEMHVLDESEETFLDPEIGQFPLQYHQQTNENCMDNRNHQPEIPDSTIYANATSILPQQNASHIQSNIKKETITSAVHELANLHKFSCKNIKQEISMLAESEETFLDPEISQFSLQYHQQLSENCIDNRNQLGFPESTKHANDASILSQQNEPHLQSTIEKENITSAVHEFANLHKSPKYLNSSMLSENIKQEMSVLAESEEAFLGAETGQLPLQYHQETSENFMDYQNHQPEIPESNIHANDTRILSHQNEPHLQSTIKNENITSVPYELANLHQSPKYPIPESEETFLDPEIGQLPLEEQRTSAKRTKNRNRKPEFLQTTIQTNDTGILSEQNEWHIQTTIKKENITSAAHQLLTNLHKFQKYQAFKKRILNHQTTQKTHSRIPAAKSGDMNVESKDVIQINSDSEDESDTGKPLEMNKSLPYTKAERLRRNKEAAKRCRIKKKMLQNEQAMRAAFLAQENYELRQELDALKYQMTLLREELTNSLKC